MEPTGRIFEVKRFAVHDGPGIRTTVFFKGCPLSCLWCHNPEGIDAAPEIALLERRCIRCKACVTACPRGLHEIGEDGRHTVRREDCRFCLACVDACMPQALKFYGECYSAEKLLELAAADLDFYKQSGGGVTCSGGEPLMQADFVAAFLALCRSAGIHTAVDTSGCVPSSNFETVLPVTDLFLYDLKHMDSAAHKRLTGVGNRLILRNLAMLSERGASVEIRMPVVPGLNDGARNIGEMAAFLKGIRTLTLIRPLPYHALSGSKYASIGKSSDMPAATGEEAGAARRVADALAGEGLPVCFD